MRLFVSNLNYEATEHDLRVLFTAQGFPPPSVKICSNRETGQPRGFAFLEFRKADEAEGAIRSLDGWMFMGRRINVQKARELGSAIEGE